MPVNTPREGSIPGGLSWPRRPARAPVDYLAPRNDGAAVRAATLKEIAPVDAGAPFTRDGDHRAAPFAAKTPIDARPAVEE